MSTVAAHIPLRGHGLPNTVSVVSRVSGVILMAGGAWLALMKRA